MDEQYFKILREDMQKGFEGVHDRLDALNGRTRIVESKVAVLDAANTGMVRFTGPLGAILGAAAGAYAWWKG